jgi:hypothetical protein
MSLRKSPEFTPELLKVFRQNAQHATGPRSPAGKENVKMNALKHGFYSAAQNHQIAMLALGEDPKEFQVLQENLLTTFGPGDELWCRQIEDLAKLYWRRSRLERMQSGVMRRALQEVEEKQHRREIETANATFEPSHYEMLDIGMGETTDPGVRLRRILSTLGVIRAQVAQTSAVQVCGSSPGSDTTRGPQTQGSNATGGIGTVAQAIDNQQSTIGNGESATDNRQSTIENRQSPIADHQSTIERLYRGRMGWRMARICRLLRLFWDSSQAGLEEQDETPQACECDLQELLRLLDEEIAAVEPEFEYAEKLNAERAAIERDACLAPAGDTWRMMLRQESSLDRSIDRKVKIILGMRKNHIDDSLNVLMAEAGLKGSKDSETDPEMEEINRMLGIDIPSEESATDTAAEDRAPLEPPEQQNSRNKPGMCKKTKGNAPEAWSDKMYQTTTNLDADGGSASQNAAA